MKKLMIAALAVAALVVSAQAKTYWSTWYDGEAQGADVGKAVVLGLASDIQAIKGPQIDVCVNKAEKVENGCQVTFGYNRTVTLRNGCQVGFWNNAKSSALQIGLICHNETGFLPWFPFFNFDKHMFGPAK